MEIERKYLLDQLPENLTSYPCKKIEQGYLSTEPVVRIRRSDDEYYLTYKSKGLMVREEYNLPLTKESYLHLREKADGVLISKTRYLLPLTGTDLTIELDVFDAPYEGLYLAEVEFPDEASANAFVPPVWFGKDVTYSSDYHNSTLSKGKNYKLPEKIPVPFPRLPGFFRSFVFYSFCACFLLVLVCFFVHTFFVFAAFTLASFCQSGGAAPSNPLPLISGCRLVLHQ
jgi:adenylate cyclase